MDRNIVSVSQLRELDTFICAEGEGGPYIVVGPCSVESKKFSVPAMDAKTGWELLFKYPSPEALVGLLDRTSPEGETTYF